MAEILKKISSETRDWPRRFNNDLFVHSDGAISHIKNKAALFGFLQNTTGLVEWTGGDAAFCAALAGCPIKVGFGHSPIVLLRKQNARISIMTAQILSQMSLV